MIDRIRCDGLSYRSFSTPEELAGLAVDDLAVLLSERFEIPEEPAGASLARPRWPLPEPPSSSVGRKREVAGLRNLLGTPATRLVTLRRYWRNRQDAPGTAGRSRSRGIVPGRGGTRAAGRGALGGPRPGPRLTSEAHGDPVQGVALVRS